MPLFYDGHLDVGADLFDVGADLYDAKDVLPTLRSSQHPVLELLASGHLAGGTLSNGVHLSAKATMAFVPSDSSMEVAANAPLATCSLP